MAALAGARVGYMCAMFRRGGRSIHPAEEIFSRDMEKKLPDDFIVVPNATLETGSADFDLDSTLIGPMGVVVVELKTWKGPIEIQPGRTWRRYLNGEWTTVPSPLESVQYKQRRFHTILHDLGMTHVSVLGIVALFGEKYTLRGRREARRHVLSASKVAEEMLGRKLVYHMPNIRATTMSERIAIADLLSSKPGSGAPFIQGYDVGPLVDSNEQENWFEYPGTEKLTGRKVRVRVWPNRIQRDDGGPALREARALSLVYSAQVVRYFLTCPAYDHDDTLITVTEDLPANYIDGYFAPPQRPTRDVARHWARLAFGGLDACHEHGVVHRNVNPRSIRIVEGRGPVLTDFQRARVPGIPTIGAMVFPANAYAAPELTDSLAPASTRSDLYSMAAVFASLVGAATESGTDSRRFVLREAFGERTGEVLDGYLASDPEQRPGSAREVLATF